MKQSLQSQVERDRKDLAALGAMISDANSQKEDMLEKIKTLLKNHDASFTEEELLEYPLLKGEINPKAQSRAALLFEYKLTDNSYRNWKMSMQAMTNVGAFLALNSVRDQLTFGVDLFVLPYKYKDDLLKKGYFNRTSFSILPDFDSETRESAISIQAFKAECAFTSDVVELKQGFLTLSDPVSCLSVFIHGVDSIRHKLPRGVELKLIPGECAYDIEFNPKSISVGCIGLSDDANLHQLLEPLIDGHAKAAATQTHCKHHTYVYEKGDLSFQSCEELNRIFCNNLKECGFIDILPVRYAKSAIDSVQFSRQVKCILPTIGLRSDTPEQDIRQRKDHPGEIKPSVMDDIKDGILAICYSLNQMGRQQAKPAEK